MPQLELRLPPPLVAAITGLLMWVFATLFAPFDFTGETSRFLAYGFSAVGSVLLIPAILAFITFKTTINPTPPEQSVQLITTGIFRLSRNPIYLGLLLMLVGWGIWLATPIALVVATLFPLLMTRFQIIPEERALETLFGEQFLAYKQRVRRWI